jgi:hypothetical protein
MTKPMRCFALIWVAACQLLGVPFGCTTSSNDERNSNVPRGAIVASATDAGSRAPTAGMEQWSPKSPSLAATLRYPPARWRLVSPLTLNSVLLNVSHILIRHAGIIADQAAFSAGDWAVPYPKTARSAEDALQLIQQVAEWARRGQPFAQLAQEYSEDPLTRLQGGGLGSQSAAQFIMWPDVLDLLAQVPIGEVSRPILMESGFHIFLRHPPPSPRTRGGRRIVIGHGGAPWLQFNARGPLRTRTRDEALAVAWELHRDLVAHPERFDAKAREFSEHLEAERGGDIGEWSTLEPSPVWLELEVLDGLDIGEVSEPIDGAFGIEILQRTPIRTRTTYGATVLRLPFQPGVAEVDNYSEQVVFERAKELATNIAANPGSLSEYQKQYCCREIERVVEGREWPPLEVALRTLKPGEVETRPVLGWASQHWVVRREPAPPAPSVSFDLPDPPRPDIAWFVAEDGHLAAKALARIGDRVSELNLPNDLAAKVRQQIASMVHLKDLGSEARLRAFDGCAARVKNLLAPTDYARFLRMVDSEFEHLLLAPF